MFRYTGGFLVRQLREDCHGDLDLKTIGDLVDTAEDGEPDENEEWMGAIDRGGLVWISSNLYQTICASEYVIRTHLRNDTIPIGKIKSEVIVEAIINDADVQFFWNLASTQMDEDTSEKLLDRVANAWLTIRKHSFAKSILEQYKREIKQSVQKKKPLGSTLSTKEGDISDSD